MAHPSWNTPTGQAFYDEIRAAAERNPHIRVDLFECDVKHHNGKISAWYRYQYGEKYYGIYDVIHVARVNDAALRARSIASRMDTFSKSIYFMMECDAVNGPVSQDARVRIGVDVFGQEVWESMVEADPAWLRGL